MRRADQPLAYALWASIWFCSLNSSSHGYCPPLSHCAFVSLWQHVRIFKIQRMSVHKNHVSYLSASFKPRIRIVGDQMKGASTGASARPSEGRALLWFSLVLLTSPVVHPLYYPSAVNKTLWYLQIQLFYKELSKYYQHQIKQNVSNTITVIVSTTLHFSVEHLLWCRCIPPASRNEVTPVL